MRGIGNYHLKSQGLNYDIVDLISGNSMLNPYISSSMLVFGSVPLIFEAGPNSERLLPKIMGDPFTCLRQCNTFEKSSWRAELWMPDLLHLDDIISELEEKIEDIEL
jgi:hypothetical protein